MDQQQFSDYGSQQPQQPQQKGGGAFAAVVIIIVLVLLAAMCVGLFWPSITGNEQAYGVPTPRPTAPFTTS